MNPTDKGPALEDSITLSNWNEIPYISCIELPCYIKSNSTGVAMLGGDNALHQHVHKQAQRIPLMLSAPGSERDPLRPPIVGQLRPCQGIVIKLIRRVIKDANGSVLSSRLVGAAAVGKLDRSYQFTAPADFQVLSWCAQIIIDYLSKALLLPYAKITT